MRLASAIEKQGVRVTDKKPHVNLVFIKGIRLKCKNIFRLDGVWMNTSMSYRKKNKKLDRIIKSCDGLIYQNEFCKQASDNFLGKYPEHAIIQNGAPMNLGGEEVYKHPRPYLLTLCRWRPHKRLKAIVRGFLNSGLHADYDLLVLGEKPDYVKKHPAVIYKGQVGKKLPSMIRGCEYVVHLAFIDWCPNSVVESIVCRKNVLHTTSGGTKYVVKDNGICIKDEKWNFKPIELYKPPKLNKDELSKGYHSMLDLPAPDPSYLDINIIASKYIDYCRKIVK